jgi:hypothetical protein
LGAHDRLLQRYRVLFRASTAAFGAAILLIILGALAAIFSSYMNVLAAGVLLAAMSGLFAYKIAVSTMKVIDSDPDEHTWRNLSL